MAKVKLIEVGGTSCGVCKMMKPMVDKAVSMLAGEDFEFAYIVGDTDEGKAQIETAGISSVTKVPSFHILVEGEEKEMFNGGIALPALVQKIKAYL